MGKGRVLTGLRSSATQLAFPCRRWWNHLSPQVKKGPFTDWEDAVIIRVRGVNTDTGVAQCTPKLHTSSVRHGSSAQRGCALVIALFSCAVPREVWQQVVRCVQTWRGVDRGAPPESRSGELRARSAASPPSSEI